LNNIFVKKFDIISDIPFLTDNRYLIAGVSSCCNGTTKYYKDSVFRYSSKVTIVDIEVDSNIVKSYIYNDGTIPTQINKTRATRGEGKRIQSSRTKPKTKVVNFDFKKI